MDALLELESWRTLTVLLPLGALLVPAAVTDALYGRIPNTLTYPGFLLGLAAHAVAWGWSGLAASFGAALLTLLVGLLLRAPGWIGGGDVKLLVGVAAFLGLGGLAESLFYAIWVGFVLGVVQALTRGELVAMFRRIGRFLLGLIRSVGYRTDQLLEELETSDASKIPFGVAVGAGVGLALSEAHFDWPGMLTFFFTGTPLG